MKLKHLLLKHHILLLLLLTFPFFAIAQPEATKNLKKIDDRFDAAIAQYEGFPPIPFEAPDMEGNKHLLEHYKGQIVILHFWNIYCQPCLTQITSLNKLVEEYEAQGLTVLGFADDYGQDLEDFVRDNEVKYPIVPNSRELGMMAYAGDLGYPRIFVIDEYGVIHRVLFGGSLDDYWDTYEQLKPILDNLLK